MRIIASSSSSSSLQKCFVVLFVMITQGWMNHNYVSGSPSSSSNAANNNNKLKTGTIIFSSHRNLSLTEPRHVEHISCVSLHNELLFHFQLSDVVKDCPAGFDVIRAVALLDGAIASSSVGTAQLEVRIAQFPWTMLDTWKDLPRTERDAATSLLCSGELFDFGGPLRCPLHLEKLKKIFDIDTTTVSYWVTSDQPSPLVCLSKFEFELEYQCESVNELHRTHLTFDSTTQCFEHWVRSNRFAMFQPGCHKDALGHTYGTAYVGLAGFYYLDYTLPTPVRSTQITLIYRTRDLPPEDGAHSSFLFLSEHGTCVEIYTDRAQPTRDGHDAIHELPGNVILNSQHVGFTKPANEWTNITIFLVWRYVGESVVSGVAIDGREFSIEPVPFLRTCFTKDTSHADPHAASIEHSRKTTLNNLPAINTIRLSPLLANVWLDVDDIVLTHPTLIRNSPPYLKLVDTEFTVPQNAALQRCFKAVEDYGDADQQQVVTLEASVLENVTCHPIRSVAINRSGYLCLDILRDTSGSCKVVVAALDDGQGTTGAKSVHEYITIVVGPEIENSPPSFTIKSAIVLHDTYGTFSKVVISNIHDPDPNQRFTIDHYVTPVGSEDWLLSEPTVLDATGVLSFKTHAGRVGNITLHVTVTDDGAGTIGGPRSSSEALLVISIVPKSSRQHNSVKHNILHTPGPSSTRIMGQSEQHLTTRIPHGTAVALPGEGASSSSSSSVMIETDDGTGTVSETGGGVDPTANKVAVVIFFGMCVCVCLCMIRRKGVMWKLLYPYHKTS
eukprot:PhF_6_TR37567/c0_g1_i1/m.55671